MVRWRGRRWWGAVDVGLGPTRGLNHPPGGGSGKAGTLITGEVTRSLFMRCYGAGGRIMTGEIVRKRTIPAIRRMGGDITTTVRETVSYTRAFIAQ